MYKLTCCAEVLLIHLMVKTIIHLLTTYKEGFYVLTCKLLGLVFILDTVSFNM